MNNLARGALVGVVSLGLALGAVVADTDGADAGKRGRRNNKATVTQSNEAVLVGINDGGSYANNHQSVDQRVYQSNESEVEQQSGGFDD